MTLLAEHLRKEINKDGFQFERTVHYHLSDIGNYFYVYQLVKNSNLKVSCVHPGGIKTNIVVNGRMHASMIGEQSHAQQIEEFNKMARTTPAKAALTILNGVRKNKRRILIGQDAKFMDRLQRLFPAKYTDIFGALLKLAR
jgi:short-subunit dehydrogenase